MDNPGEKQGLNAASDPRSAGERELEPAASDYVHGVPERDAGDHGSVSPLFGRGATLALLVWGFSVLAFTSSVAGVTMLWPLVPIVGAVVPLALVFLAVQHANNQKKALRGDEIRTLLVTKDSAERAVLGALLKSNGLTEGSLVYALRDSGRPSPGYASLGSSESRDEDRSELSPSTGPLDEPLTEREIEVMRLLASGRTNREISHELYVSHGTVKAHAANIYRKLDVHNRAEMINRAKTLDLLD